MSNPWKTSWNAIASFSLFIFSLWLWIDDFLYPGDIVFQTSIPMVYLTLFAIISFGMAHCFSIYPKRIIFPFFILMASRWMIGFPLNLWMSNNTACELISAALVLSTGIYFFGTIFKFLGLDRRPWFNLKHTVTVFLTGLLMSIAAIPFAVFGFAATAENVLGDYTRFTPLSISLRERVFVKDGKKVFLIGMMHIGDPKFYAEIDARMKSKTDGKRVILTEGVSDKEGILPSDFKSGKTYGKWAKKFNLGVQNSGEYSLSEAEIEKDREKWAAQGIAFLNADIDISELSKEHQELLVKILEAVNSDHFLDLVLGPSDIDGQDIEDLMTEGLLKLRNDRLMGFFDETMKLDVDEIFIPWGAAHLPDVEKRLLSEGFEKISEETRPVVRIWNKITSS